MSQELYVVNKRFRVCHLISQKHFYEKSLRRLWLVEINNVFDACIAQTKGQKGT